MTGSRFDRRGFLRSVAGVSVVALAGCADPRAVLTLNEVDNSGIADRVAVEIDESDDVVVSAVENGTYTTEGDSSGLEAPFEARPVVYEGTYYDITVEATTVSEDRLYLLRVENVGDESVEGEVAYEELTDADREALNAALDAEGASEEGFEGGTEFLYSEEEAADSVLVDGATVVYEGSRYSVEGERRETVGRSEYTYTANEVAGSADEFGDWARDTYMFVLGTLSEEERGVVEDAIDGGYYEGTVTDGYEGIARRFHSHEAVTSDDRGGEWVVEYDGTTYWAELTHPSTVLEDG